MMVDSLKASYLSDALAKQQVFDLFNEGSMPLHLFDDVVKYYFHPGEDQPDCKPRNLWGLNNSCTRAIQTLKPAAQFDAAINVGRHFRLTTEEE